MCIRDSFEKTLGAEHPQVASNLVNLGNAFCDQQKHIEAVPVYLRALAIDEKALGDRAAAWAAASAPARVAGAARRAPERGLAPCGLRIRGRGAGGEPTGVVERGPARAP